MSSLTTPSIEFYYYNNSYNTYVELNSLSVEVFDGQTILQSGRRLDSAGWRRQIDISLTSIYIALDL